MNKYTVRSIGAILLSTLFCSSVCATTYTFLSNPALSGNLAGPDLFWDSGDELGPGEEILPEISFNPAGNASGFLFDNTPVFGSIGGSFEVTGTTVTDYNVQGTFNDFSDGSNPVIGATIFESLTPGTTSSFIVNNDNTAAGNFFIDVSDGINPPNSFNLFPHPDFGGTYAHFNNGEDHNVIFAGAAFDILRAQIDFFLPLMPLNWETMFIGIERFEFLSLEDENGNLLAGNQGVVFYTTVPEPATFALMLLGIAGLGLVRRK